MAIYCKKEDNDQKAQKKIISTVNQEWSTVGYFYFPLLNYLNIKRESLHLGSDLKKVANYSSHFKGLKLGLPATSNYTEL